jgi:hypothetical protein
VKFCRDALSRQVGEAVRIGLRRNTLNSKSGYNRSGTSRLNLAEADTNWLKSSENIDTTILEEKGEEQIEKRRLEMAGKSSRLEISIDQREGNMKCWMTTGDWEQDKV